MVQYYTLEEAAKVLHTTPDKLREMANRKEVRAFQDRGSLRFRAAEIDELARARGLGSDAEVQFGESGPKSTSGSKSPSPTPKKKGDSSVKLVADENLDFNVADEGAKSSSKSGPKSPPSGSKPASKSPSSTGRKSKLVDSGVRMVGQDKASDSDVKLQPGEEEVQLTQSKKKSPSDSDIRLEDLPSARPPGKGSDPALVTEEIDLDAEAKKAAEIHKAQQPQKTKSKVERPPALPTSSPFELSEDDLTVGSPPAAKEPAAKGSPKQKDPSKEDVDSSSDFELIPFDPSKSPMELGSGEIPLLEGDEDVGLGSEVRAGRGNSGINLQDPADSGISLEQGGSDEIEFELSLDAPPTTPKPAPAKQAADDSSSEFELSLDESPSDPSSSEFELSLDEDEGDIGLKKLNEDSSSSEFELTLDEEGGLAAVHSDALESDEKDIFEETNFDVPALDEESGSEAVVLDEGDTDLEGSDFEISMDESDSDTGESSGSQVVALDEEEDADAGAATVARPRKTKAKGKGKGAQEMVDVEEEELDLDLDRSGPRKKTRVAEEEEEEEEEERVAAAAAPAEWGPVPAILLFPAVLVLFVVGLMSFELVQGMWGYHRPARVGSPVIKAIAGTFDESLPKD
jgi:excisionase family DNA binding protein